MTSTKHRYRVVGPNPFCEVATGGIVNLAADGPINIPAAVESGCIEPMSAAAERDAHPDTDSAEGTDS